jgi:hypothetical protein
MANAQNVGQLRISGAAILLIGFNRLGQEVGGNQFGSLHGRTKIPG